MVETVTEMTPLRADTCESNRSKGERKVAAPGCGLRIGWCKRRDGGDERGQRSTTPEGDDGMG
eukprot:6179352-Pleurochrysis_carterae.AAC.1